MTKKKFIRKDAHKKARLSKSWRRPDGLQNKRRLKLKGHAKNVSPGFRTANAQRYKTKEELEILTITNKDQLKQINPKSQAIIIGRTGKKRKIEIIEEAEKLKIKITNFNVEKYKEIYAKFQENKKKTMEERKQKQETKKKEEKKIEEKKKTEKQTPDAQNPAKQNSGGQNADAQNPAKQNAELTPEEKKKKEKEEKDKILIHK